MHFELLRKKVQLNGGTCILARAAQPPPSFTAAFISSLNSQSCLSPELRTANRKNVADSNPAHDGSRHSPKVRGLIGSCSGFRQPKKSAALGK
jgi:hypothetical protein